MHDRNGVEVKVGARVRIEFEIQRIYPDASDCNMQVAGVVPQGAKCYAPSLTCATVLCEVVADPQPLVVKRPAPAGGELIDNAPNEGEIHD